MLYVKKKQYNPNISLLYSFSMFFVHKWHFQANLSTQESWKRFEYM